MFYQDCVVCDEHGRDCVREKPSGTNHSLINGIQDADFVFYISTLQSVRCGKGSTIAYAAHCQQETTLNRFVMDETYNTTVILMLIRFSDQSQDMQIYARIQYRPNHKI